MHTLVTRANLPYKHAINESCLCAPWSWLAMYHDYNFWNTCMKQLTIHIGYQFQEEASASSPCMHTSDICIEWLHHAWLTCMHIHLTCTIPGTPCKKCGLHCQQWHNSISQKLGNVWLPNISRLGLEERTYQVAKRSTAHLVSPSHSCGRITCSYGNKECIAALIWSCSLVHILFASNMLWVGDGWVLWWTWGGHSLKCAS